MQMQLNNELSARVETEFAKLREQAQARFDSQSHEFDKYAWGLRTGLEQHLKEAEERVTRDVRTKVFLLSLAVVTGAIGATLIGSLAITRDVNNSVIALQKDIIAAQTAIKTASDALVEQKQKLADAEAGLTPATSALTNA